MNWPQQNKDETTKINANNAFFFVEEKEDGVDDDGEDCEMCEYIWIE